MTVNACTPMFTISPFLRGRRSGMPWQITSFTELEPMTTRFQLFAPQTQEGVRTCTQISGSVDSSRVRGMHCARLWRYGRFHRSRRSLSQVSRRRQLCPTPHEPARRDNEPNYASVGDDKGHEANLAYNTHLLLVFLAKNLRGISLRPPFRFRRTVIL